MRWIVLVGVVPPVAPDGVRLWFSPELTCLLCPPRGSLTADLFFPSHLFLLFGPVTVENSAPPAISSPPITPPFCAFWPLGFPSSGLSLSSPFSLSFHPHPHLLSSLSSYRAWLHLITPCLFSRPSPRKGEVCCSGVWTVEQAFALWGFCLLCEVFSQIAAFHSPARHITPLCVLAYVSVFGNALTLLSPENLSTVSAHF